MGIKLASNVHFGKEQGENPPECTNFAKSASFTSDGSSFSIVTNSNCIFLYDVDKNPEKISGNFDNLDNVATSDIGPSLSLKLKEDIRSFCWFPNFTKSCPDSCCFLIGSRNRPVHLYDSLTGTRHFTYKPVNACGEIPEIYSLDFHPLGKYFLCGSASCIYVFDIEHPGEHIELRRLSTRKSSGQKGIVSCISHNPFGDGNTYACGTYNSSVGVYHHNESRNVSLVGDFLDPDYPLNPVTQLKWIDETKLLVGCRNDYYLRLYDVRGDLSSPLVRFHRPVSSNQTINFDFKDNLIVSGTSNGDVIFYDLMGNQVYSERLSDLPVPVSTFFPNHSLVLLSSGTRHFEDYNLDSPLELPDPPPHSDQVPFNRVYFTGTLTKSDNIN